LKKKRLPTGSTRAKGSGPETREDWLSKRSGCQGSAGVSIPTKAWPNGSRIGAFRLSIILEWGNNVQMGIIMATAGAAAGIMMIIIMTILMILRGRHIEKFFCFNFLNNETNTE
jgi:hypothetical protein